MNKHVVIAIIASIVIASPFIFSVWNIYTVDHLQIRGQEKEQFKFFDLSNHNSIVVCNPLPFFVYYDKLDIEIFFNEKHEGTYSISSVTIPPSSSAILNGTFSSDMIAEAQYLFLHLDGEFSGSVPVRVDPTKMLVATEFQTPIIGIIPYSVIKQYSGFDFWNVMNWDNGNFNC